MSLLSDFLPKSYLGLALAADVLTFAKANAQLLVSSTDTTAGGADFPRIIARNARQAAGAGGELRFECRNTTPADFVAAKIKGSLTTLTAAAEVGKLELMAANAGSYRGVVVGEAALYPATNGVETLGKTGAGYGGLFLYDTGAAIAVTLDPGATTSLVFGGTDFEVRSNGKTYNFAVDAYGARVFRAAPAGDSLLAIGDASNSTYFSQTASGTAYGINVSLGIPSNVVTEATGVIIDMAQAAASFTTANVYGLKVGSWSSGVGASATNAYGVYIDSLGINATLKYGLKIAGIHNYAIHSLGAGPVLLSSTTVTDDTNAPALVGVLSVETVETTLSSVPALWLQATTTGYAPTTALAVFEGPDAGTAGLILARGAGTTAFSVRADGVTVVGNSGRLSTAKLSVAGRIASNGNDTYDLSGNTLAVDAIIASTHSVGLSNSAQMIRLAGTMALTAANAQGVGLYADITASTHNGLANLHGIYAQVSSAGSGDAYGMTVNAIASTGFTGYLAGLSVLLTTQTGMSSNGIHVRHAGTLGHGILIEASVANSDLGYGVRISGNSKVTSAAYSYLQRSGSFADAFLYTGSSGGTLFKVTYEGNIELGGTIRRFKADMDSTGAARFGFQTSNSSATTLVAAMPSLGGSQSGFMAHDASDMDNAARVLLYVNNTAAVLSTSQTGTGVTRAMQFQIVTTTVLQLHTNTDLVLGPGSMATGATAGFPYIPTCAGAPTGAATSRSGYAPIIVDETNSRFYVRVGSTWKYVAVA